MDPDWSEKFKVLADYTRLSVVNLLLERPRNVGELCEELHVEQTLLSHHLKVMREAGFVESSRQGKAVIYCLAPSVACSVAGRAIDLGCCQISFRTC